MELTRSSDMSSDQTLGYLMYIGEYTAQLYWDYNTPFWALPKNPVIISGSFFFEGNPY